MLGATLLFSINYWIAKGLMPVPFKPMHIIFFRVSGSLLLYFLFDSLFLRKKNRAVEKKDLLRIFFAGVLGVALNQILFFSGLNLTTPVDTAIINSTNPLMVLLISALLTSDKLGVKNIIGILLGATGATSLILYDKTESFLEGSINGNLLIMANTFCWSLYLIVAKPLFAKYHPIQVMKWVFFVGFLASVPFTFQDLQSIQLESVSPKAIWSLIYVIVGTTFLAYLLITYGLSYLSPAIVSVYTYAQPALVAIIGFVLLNEGLTISKMISFLLVFIGILLAGRK
jgi:drug/metabolite transporter (DMT)-like permease